MGPGGGGADGSRPRSTSTGRREVADGRPRHARDGDCAAPELGTRLEGEGAPMAG